MAAATDNDLKMLYLRSAKIDGSSRLFSIGPFGARVSFASQQRRALNTVWALEQDAKIKAGSKVAVIGGGLAGLMASVALASRQCTVHLFERGQRILNLQQISIHRYLHPTVNFWPEVDLEPTTTFPFLDWHAEKCSEVIDALQAEWEKHFRQWIPKVYLGADVNKIVDNGSGIIVSSSGVGVPPEHGPFDIAILAVGFGRELDIKGVNSKTYWEYDSTADAEGACTTKMVSGVGDGGLIDILRVIHTKFRRGRLALDLIEILNATGLRQRIRDLEADVSSAHSGNPNDASLAYEKGYIEILADAPPAVLQPLNNSLRTDLSMPIRLIGRTPAPYSLVAAPIHKLMLTHAINKNAIAYQQAQLGDGPTISSGQIELPCIIRHGPANDMSNLLTKAQIEDLKARQTVISDILGQPPYDGSYWYRWGDYPLQKADNPKFINKRHSAAARFVMAEFEETLFKDTSAYYVEENPDAEDISRKLPKKLFSVKTELRPRKIFSAG